MFAILNPLIFILPLTALQAMLQVFLIHPASGFAKPLLIRCS
jgi:hypothetical protein